MFGLISNSLAIPVCLDCGNKLSPFDDTLKTLEKNPIENVFVNWNIDNLYTPTVVIIGPKNTPYENGFYCIKFKFTEKFPFERKDIFIRF